MFCVPGNVVSSGAQIRTFVCAVINCLLMSGCLSTCPFRFFSRVELVSDT